MRRHLPLFLLLLLGATASWAQPVTPTVVFSPSAPSSADVIRASFTVRIGCTRTNTTTISGSTVRTDVFLTDCAPGGPSVESVMSVFFGPLPSGTYTYQVYVSDMGAPPALRATQPLVVTAAPSAVPALSPATLWTLIAALVASAWFSLGRMSLR